MNAWVTSGCRGALEINQFRPMTSSTMSTTIDTASQPAALANPPSRLGAIRIDSSRSSAAMIGSQVPSVSSRS